MSPLRPLFSGLLDDAAMFPPGNATPAAALDAHLAHRASWYADLVGPLLVHCDRWPEFVAAHAHAGAPDVEVGLIGSAELPSDVPADVRVIGSETVVRQLPLPAGGTGRVLACEVSADPAGFEAFAEIARSRARGEAVIGKYRTGGTTPEAFPSIDQLVAVVMAAAAAEAPMKFTAGLHHAARFTAADTGFEHHGFLNLLVAVEAARRGAAEPTLAALLGERDAGRLAATVTSWTEDQFSGVRSAFVSFGCCGVQDPVNDLVALQLIDKEDV